MKETWKDIEGFGGFYQISNLGAVKSVPHKVSNGHGYFTTKEKILILVKTYPHKSNKYIETVCTAGIREDGSWVRLFPVPYRLYTNDQQYGKYQWVECSYYKAKDPRPESCHIDIDQQLVLGDKIGTQDNWELRRRAVLDKAKILTKFSELKQLVNENSGSLGKCVQ